MTIIHNWYIVTIKEVAMRRNKKEKRPLQWWAVFLGLVLIILQIIDKVLDLVPKVIRMLAE